VVAIDLALSLAQPSTVPLTQVPGMLQECEDPGNAQRSQDHHIAEE